MAKKNSLDTVAALRLTPPIVKQSDRLIRALQNDPVLSLTGKITRSTVLRIAIVKGLAVMEKEYGGKK